MKEQRTRTRTREQGDFGNKEQGEIGNKGTREVHIAKLVPKGAGTSPQRGRR